MEKKYTEERTTVRTIKTEPFAKSLVKVIDTRDVTTNGEYSQDVKILITSQDNVDKVSGLENISELIYAPKMYQQRAMVCLIQKENYQKMMRAERHVSEVVEKYDDEKYNTGDYIPVLFNWGSYTLADLNGELIPLPVHVEYIDACMSNEYYNLDKVIEKISGDERVLLPNDTELKIRNIPYYNCTETESEYLDFYFIPSREIYEKGLGMDLNKWRYMLEHTFDIEDCRK